MPQAMDPLKDLDVKAQPHKHRNQCLHCLKLTPWFTFLACAVFTAGLVVFSISASNFKDSAVKFTTLLGGSQDASDLVDRASVIAIISITIAGAVIVGLVLLMGLVQMAQRTRLWGGCCGSCGKPSTWGFTAFKVINALLVLLTWALLLGVVVVLMASLLFWGASYGLERAIDEGTQAADEALLDQFELATDASASILEPFQKLVRNSLGDNSYAAVAPLCSPVCLNLGSFAAILDVESSCICGAERINALGSTAGDAASQAVVALGGAGAMYVAVSLLLMVLATSHVVASYDRQSARAMKAQRERAYEAGFAADPADCVAAPVMAADMGRVDGAQSAGAAATGVAPAGQPSGGMMYVGRGDGRYLV